MNIHVYTLCWNEEFLLPFFLKHYSFASLITVLDNHSTDRSAEIIDACPNAVGVPFSTGGQMRERELMNLRNEQYKQSRGRADWVIVVDVDEFLYHPNLLEVLARYKKEGVQVPRTTGYQMVSNDAPVEGISITEQVRCGYQERLFDKAAVFDPSVNIWFGPGSHSYSVANAVTGEERELLLLHYKYLGKDWFLKRMQARRPRVSKKDVAEGMNLHYLRSDKEHEDDFIRAVCVARPVIGELSA